MAGDNANRFIVTRDEYLQGMQEQVDNIRDVMRVVNTLRATLNTQAEILGCHRYLLERFIPAPTLAAAVNEYSELRAKAIEQERLRDNGIPASKDGN